jgi:hypothetical protein
MPWKTSSVMEEKLRFVFEYDAGEHTMTELCQRYEIARETGYVCGGIAKPEYPGWWSGVAPRTGIATRCRKRLSAWSWNCGRRI